MRPSDFKAHILLVDDEPGNLQLLSSILRPRGLSLSLAQSGPEALSIAAHKLPDLILLDIVMPEMDGFEVCRRLKAEPAGAAIPLIFLTGRHATDDIVTGFQLGAVDYITKPFHPAELLARVLTHLELKQSRDQILAQNQQLAAQNNELQSFARFKEQQGEQQYRRLVENVADGIGILQQGQFVFVNDALRRLLADSSADLYGRRLDEWVLASDQSRLHQAEAFLQTGDDPVRWQSIQFRLPPPHVETWIDARYSRIEWEGHPAVVMTMRDITAHKAREQEIEQEKTHLHQINQALRATMKDRYKFGEIIGKSAAMQAVYEQMLQAAASEASVIVYGESGTGKELVAWTIHTLSQRRDKTFIPVNCGAIQETLFESEFFGHRKGAFTGAYEDKRGFFDHAHGGTLFLDEVAELTPPMQAKLLRVLSGGEYTPVGDHRIKHANARIIAATNQDFSALVAQGRIREDFYYRVAVVPITIPPLRQRREDIAVLIDHFLEQFCGKDERPALPGQVLLDLYEYDWPGNVRELQNVLQRYLTTKRLDFLAPRHVSRALDLSDRTPEKSPLESQPATFHAAVASFEKQELVQVLEQHRWNRTHAAAALGITRRSLFRLMQKHGLL